MPILDWRCKNCEAKTEALVKISEVDDYKPEFTCCDKQDLQRYIPKKGAAKFAPTAAWSRHGKKGHW